MCPSLDSSCQRGVPFGRIPLLISLASKNVDYLVPSMHLTVVGQQVKVLPASPGLQDPGLRFLHSSLSGRTCCSSMSGHQGAPSLVS